MGQRLSLAEWDKMTAPPRRPFEPDFLEEYTKPAIIEELRRVAKIIGSDTVRVSDLQEHGRVNYAVVTAKFGSMADALEEAGLRGTRHVKATRGRMLERLRKLWMVTMREHGRSPRAHDLQRYGFPHSFSAIARTFGSWRSALVEAATYGTKEGSPLIREPRPKRRARRRANQSDRTRFLVFKRDAYRCRICGQSGGELEVDHVVPRARGGRETFSNLQTTCRACNRGKRADLQRDKDLPANRQRRRKQPAPNDPLN